MGLEYCHLSVRVCVISKGIRYTSVLIYHEKRYIYSLIACIQYIYSTVFIVWIQQTRIGLSLFDIQGMGYLKESVSPLLDDRELYVR